MSRRHRIVATLLAAFTLVFAQLAVSAHACELVVQSMATQAAPGHECCAEDVGDGTNPAGGNVCVEHCQHVQASFDNGQPAPGIVETAGPALRVDAGDPALSADGRPAWLLVPPAASPPAAILFGVLRI